MPLETIIQAIKSRQSLSFEYNKEGKVAGSRYGNPHAIFIMRRKDNSESTKVHIVQTGGVSDSGQEMPSWRMFDLMELSNVVVMPSETKFEIFVTYNPEWDGYKYVIAKV